MKEKIIEIIGFGMEHERAELKAREIINLFNTRVVSTLEEIKTDADRKTFDAVAKLFTHL